MLQAEKRVHLPMGHALPDLGKVRLGDVAAVGHPPGRAGARPVQAGPGYLGAEHGRAAVHERGGPSLGVKAGPVRPEDAVEQRPAHVAGKHPVVVRRCPWRVAEVPDGGVRGAAAQPVTEQPRGQAQVVILDQHPQAARRRLIRDQHFLVQGLGERGLKMLAKARKETGLGIITELLSEQHAELVAEYTDIIQIGARNSQNFQLLIAAAKTGKPVLLKRGLSMKIEEWLLAGEYVLSNENPGLMFCERGIRTFETYTRNTLDLSAIPIIKKESHCPIVIDPSQAAGRADLVASMCKGAVTMGADALLIEVHPNPAEALSDGAQQVSLEIFAKLMQDLRPLILAAGRE